MDIHAQVNELQLLRSDWTVKTNEPLAPYTTIKIGGPGEIFIEVRKQSQFFDVLKFLHSHPNLPFTILGGGSNVVISDNGLPGLTVRNLASQIKVLPKVYPGLPGFKATDTHRKEDDPNAYLDFSKIDYDESRLPTQKVIITAGTPLPLAINQLINQGLTGLQWFAYIPGTIGGAVIQNLHGGKYHFSDYITEVKVFDLSNGKTNKFKKDDLPWSYENSYFLDHPQLIILSVTLRLFRGDKELAANVAKAWIAQKARVQPMNSCGSVFANPALADCQRLWGEQKSTGWVIDQQLGLKGKQIGGAQISLQHANFIVNTGSATASDYKKLVDLITSEAKSKLNLTLTPEVRFLE